MQLTRRIARPSERRALGLYLAEGVRLVAEAVAAGASSPLALYDPDALHRTPAGTALLEAIPSWAEAAHEAAPHVIAAAAQTDTPAGVVAVLRRTVPPPLRSHAVDRLGLILDGLSDPGNAGTILRTADAFGVGYVISTAGSVDLFSPKVVRSGMGAHFRIDLYDHMSWDDVFSALPDMVLLVADSSGDEPLPSVRWPEHAALVIGSEAAGVSATARRLAQIRVRIPIRPGVESLNAAAAAAVLLYAASDLTDFGGD